MTTTTTAPTTTKKHPIRGFLYGIPFGLGLAMIAIGQKWAALGTWPPVMIFVAGIVIGTAWSTFGPARAPKSPSPVSEPDDELTETLETD
ncbi:MAG: hypothetical protein R2707_01840 [Acidimicrobiales bacterium]